MTISSPQQEPYFVVGIGASAGGLKALQNFFDHIPDTTDMSFILIQHLSSEHKSMMGEILQKHTNLKIETVKQICRPKPNHLYLMPNDKNLIINEDGRVSTVAKPQDKPVNMPIDLFFDSLGKVYNDCAIGVILSGTGTDGSRGIKTLKERGGLVLCQSPESSEFDGMPNASLELGLVDYSGSPENLAAKLAGIGKSFEEGTMQLNQKHQALEEEFFSKILKHTSEYTGVNFEKAYRKTTLKRRIEKRMRVRQVSSMQAYFEIIQNKPEEVSLLKQEFYIGVTHFFRDPEAWEKLEQHFSNLHAEQPRKHYRVWVAGCSTGEEAYSIAMLLEELSKKSENPFRYKIFATDLDSTALQRASQGVFNQSNVYEIPPKYVSTNFNRGKNDTLVIKKNLRDNIVFSQHDLLTDPPFLHIDLLICRNLLIYFEAEYQENILYHIKFSLDENSILFLGPSETLGSTHQSDFRNLNSQWNLFQLKNKTAKRVIFKPHQLRLTHSNVENIENNYSSLQAARANISSPPQQGNLMFEDALQHYFAYAAIFIDPEGTIVYSKGSVEEYIYFPQTSMSFYECLPKQTAILVRSAVRKVSTQGKEIVFAPLEYKRGKRKISARLNISLIDSDEVDNCYILLQFSEYVSDQENERKEVWNIHQHGNLDQVHLLEAELEATQLRLQKTVEDLEVTNEALQTSNEELLSSNEELQSSNEELQSVNEELHTVNDEFQNKIDELREANNDIDNLISSTNIGTLFLDKSFCIRKITPTIQMLFAMTHKDIGRPFNAFTHSFVDIKEEAILKEAKRVYHSLNSYEQELTTREGRVFLMKIQPFRTDKNVVNGTVLTFVDITDLKKAQKDTEKVQRLFQTAFESATIGNALFDEAGVIKKVNTSLCKLLDTQESELLGKSVYTCLPIPQDGQLKSLMAGNISSYHFEARYENPHNAICWGIFYLSTIQSGAEEEQNFALQVEDITERKAVESRLKEEQKRSQKAEELAHVGSWQMQLNTREVIWSKELYRILGLPPQEKPSTRQLLKHTHPEDKEHVKEALDQAIDQHREYRVEHRVIRPDKAVRYVISQGMISHDNDTPVLLGSCIDVTAAKEQEQLLKETNDLLVRQNQQLENFTHIASHNLRAPITNIISIQEFLKTAEPGSERQQKLLDMVFRSAEDSLRTLDDVNEALRTSKNINKDIVLMQFDDILNKTMDTLKGLIQLKDAKITGDFEDCETIAYPRIYLESIFLNLLSNALKYSSPKRTPQIEFSTYCSDKDIVLKVKDNGLGINLERHGEKIFGLYKTFHAHKDSRGVGLFMTRTQIEAMGGHIHIESEVDKGTCFTIHFGFLREKNLNGSTVY